VVPSLQTTGPPPPEDAPLVAGAAAVGAAAAVAAGAAAGAEPPAEAALFTPPWPLQAPRPPCGEVVPSLHTTGPPPLEDEELAADGAAAGAAAGAAGGAAAAPAELAEADLLMPPWPLQAPRPPCGEVLPSLHTTGVLEASCADKSAGAASIAAARHAVTVSASSAFLTTFMCSSPLPRHRRAFCQREYPNQSTGGTAGRT